MIADAFSFLLELCAFAALGYWGWTVNVALAIVTPVAAMVVWGVFCSPRAGVKLSRWAKAAVQMLVQVGAAVALAVAGQVVLAVILALAVLVDQGLRARAA